MSVDLAPSALPVSVRSKSKAVVLASLGSSLEMYDFIIYGIFAREIAAQFFPPMDPMSSLLGTFGVFAIGYISRPLGGIVLSSLGDRYGRRIVLLVSVLAMSASTIAIGLVPGYAAIGIAAPLLLMLFRLTQGFFFAGELPCAITYVVEEMPARAGLVSGLVIACAIFGVLIATLVSLVLHTALDAAEIASYGWRIAFGIGGLIGFASYWVRTSLEESGEFQAIRSHVAKRPFRQLLVDYPWQIVFGIGIAGIVNASNSLLFVMLPSYFTGVLHEDASLVSLGQTAGIATLAVSMFLCGWLSDKLPSRYVHRAGSLLILVGAYPLYRLVAAHEIGPVAAFVIFGLVGGIVNGTFTYLLADLFPTRIRFSGVALALNLATVIFTAVTPVAVTQLMRGNGWTAAPGAYLGGVALIALLAGLTMKRLGGQIRP